MSFNLHDNIEQIKILNAQTLLALNEQIKKTPDASNLIKCRAVLLEIQSKLRHAEIYATLD